MVTYITRDGDVLDWIVWKHYGTTSVLEKVLEANPDLTDEKLAAGIVVKLPYFEAVEKKSEEIKLWS